MFFLVFFVTSNVFAEITAEQVEGLEVVKIIKLYEPKGSDNFIGTLEHIRVGSEAFNLRICDKNGVEIKRSGPTGASCGSAEPIYNNSGYIEKYRHFGIRVIAYDSSQFRTLYFDLDLVPTDLINMWPEEE